MAYNLTDEVLNEIETKTNELYKLINEDVSKDYIEVLLKLHKDSRNNTAAVKHFIHKKEVKLYEDIGYEIPLYNKLGEHSDKIWEYLHIIYLLLENSHAEPNNEILVALVNKLDKQSEQLSFDNCMKEVQKVMSDGFDMSKLLENIGGLDQFNNINQSTNLLRDIVEDTKEILNKEGDVVENLVDSVKSLTSKYFNKVQNGEISKDEVLSNLMGLMSNPEEIKKIVEGIDVSKLPDPEKMMSKIMSEINNLGLPIGDVMKNLPIEDMMKGFISNNCEFDPSKLISKLMGGDVENETPLTEEQLKEMEEFYSKMTIGNEN